MTQSQTQTMTQAQRIESALEYSAPDGLIDDVYDETGAIRPQWAFLLDGIRELGPQAFQERHNKAKRILRDDGATYNIYSQPNSSAQTWNLDLVPSIITSEQWAGIESGLLERAELFDLVLKDLYGPRQLIRQGVIPPEALFAHAGFLRACQGIRMPGEHELIMHSVDMMRDASGEMCLLADRTQSPSGSAYALENRTVMSRVLPSLFRDSHVHRLASYFHRARQTLTALSPNTGEPRVVILTPGAYNETYFEHAYLANYMGLRLVQSGDLMVRNGYVWMKSLDGLSRVDVILRRVDDSYCDPVELRGDSQLGIPGLLDVVRSGRVVVANPLGSGVLENPIFLKYLPSIAKHILGRELKLKSVPTYWCADPADLRYVTRNIGELIVKPIYRGHGGRSVFGAELNALDQTQLLAKIQKTPMQFVAQPRIAPSHVPTFINGTLAPKPAVLRSFAVASGSSYTIMPGGLTRVGMSDRSMVISSQSGAKSKDTWVIDSEPERVRTQTGLTEEVPVSDADLISLPSRVVENLFWMGRYAERAEASLRLLRTVFILLNAEQSISEKCRKTLLQAVTAVTATQPGFMNASEALINNPEDELIIIIKDSNRFGSVRSNLNAMIHCADESKELLSSDTLRVINDIRDALVELDTSLTNTRAAPEEALDPLVSALMALSGLAKESMVRDFGWRFMELGKRLERSMLTTTLIQNMLVFEAPEMDQATLIEAMLLSMESLISYRRRYRARIGVQSSLDLMLLDTTNPRALLYQLEQLNEHVKTLPKASEVHHELTAKERALLECETKIKLSTLAQLSHRENGERVHLSETLALIKQRLGEVSNGISDTYFDHRDSRSRQLVNDRWES